MKLSFAIFASLLGVASASTIGATTTSTVQVVLDDMAKIGKQWTKINDLVNKFPQNGIKGAAEIHDHEDKMHTLFSKMTTSINALPQPVSTDNVQKILDAYGSFIQTSVTATNGITAKQADFVALSTSAATTMKNDLITGNAVCQIATGALRSITPPAMTDSLNNMVGLIEVATANGIAAFS